MLKNLKAFAKKNLAPLGVLATAGVLGASQAHAAIDASVGTALAAVQADAVSLSAIVVPIVVAILGLGITIKLIKRFGSKI